MVAELEHTRFEVLGGGISVCVSKEHTFGTDSFLLSAFAAPRRRDTVCDFGSGCGIIPLLWFRDANAPKRAFAVDIQPQAIEQMYASVRQSGLHEERFSVIHADLRTLHAVPPLAGLDLVTCNPPYKAANTGIISQTESDRIARHETLCTIDDVCQSAARLLRFGGRLCLCQLTERLPDVLLSMRAHGIEPKRLRFVQKNAHSAPWLFLVEGKRGSRPFLQVEPPVLIEESTLPHAFDGKSRL